MAAFIGNSPPPHTLLRLHGRAVEVLVLSESVSYMPFITGTQPLHCTCAEPCSARTTRLARRQMALVHTAAPVLARPRRCVQLWVWQGGAGTLRMDPRTRAGMAGVTALPQCSDPLCFFTAVVCSAQERTLCAAHSILARQPARCIFSGGSIL